ncbi:histidine kinase/DNA gyrase B/HSP90-like ATPase [Pseudonocardia endophytica]|uniref:Oxygen sensor histidine kinase NreB n=1 Tax=Pseudonocardia endophytica TaxID=401976 RepID=A0A4R1HY53_PSEEN|nr:histidine kinase/DNA gyrase B/HSP90-like ATPase [Pseudonocardia endophytica]
MLCCAAAVLWHPSLDTGPEPYPLSPADLALGTVWPVAGALVLRHRPGNPVGRLLLAAGLIGPYLLAGHVAVASHRDPGGPWPGAGVAAWLGSWGFTVFFLVMPLVPLLFPDGRPLSPRWRWPVWLLAGNAAATALVAACSAPSVDQAPFVPNPYALSAPAPVEPIVLAVVPVGALIAFLVGIPLGLVSTVLRLRRASGTDRTVLQWLLLGTVVQLFGAIGAGAITAALGDDVPSEEIGLLLAIAGPPLGIAVAMLRHGLFDVERVLGRTVAYAVISGAVVGSYLVVLSGAQLVLPGSTAGIVLVAVVALVAAAARDRVQRGVERLIYGDRRDPYAVVARVGRGIAAAAEPVDGLQRLTDGIRDSLRLRSAAFRTSDGRIAVRSGEPAGGAPVVVPARTLGKEVGELVLEPVVRLEAAERSVAEEVAARAAVLAYAAELVGDVARSREAIVLAREEERRRLRADLHDGLGPALAGIAHQLDALARRVAAAGEPELADRAQAVRDRVRDGVRSLRDVVHGLRPPVLDQVGLAAALRALVDDLDVPAGRSAVGELGAVPAAVEVAAYAIAGEAVTNAVRHSGAATVELDARIAHGVLALEVHDDGCGIPASPREGLGLRSTAERAAEVGGRLEVAARAGGGTVVRVELPAGGP